MLSRSDFIRKYADDARRAAAGSGIFPETILSAAILESSGKGPDGNYYPGNSLLSRAANNFFGIKAGASWKGPTYEIRTREVVKGQTIFVLAKFRKYSSARDSFADYVQFLKQNPRYGKAGVLTASSPEEQAERLQAAGYATDPQYAELLKKIITTVKQYLPPPTVALGLFVPLAVFFLLYKLRP